MSARSKGARVIVSEFEEGLHAAGLGLRRLHDEQVLKPDAVGARQVIAGLVGDDHAGLEGDGARVAGQAHRPLMHREIGADAVPGAVVEIKPDVPQSVAGEGIEMAAADTLRKAQRRYGDMALEDASDVVTKGGGRGLRPRSRSSASRP